MNLKSLSAILISVLVLSGCAVNNAPATILANTEPPHVDESFFQCPVTRGAALPSDRALAGWGVDELWTWGESAWKWGNSCADRLALAGYLRKCEQGDIQACTYVNQRFAPKED